MQTYARLTDNAAKSNNNMAASVEDHSIQMDSLQRKVDLMNAAAQRATEPIPVQRAENPPPRPNNTGLPDELKNGVESLSGYSLDDVRVHYNSPKPATVQALAYTQGNDIHVAPGQEHALPHEAWHVTQQMAGRVSPTTNIGGMPVNDNESLEHEADVMGEKAVQCKREVDGCRLNRKSVVASQIQCVRKAVLGRREEPYKTFDEGIRNDVKDLVDSKNNLATSENTIKTKINDLIKKLNLYINNLYINKPEKKDSINYYVACKIKKLIENEKEGNVDEFLSRVLNMDKWSVEENMNWLADGKAANYDSNSKISDKSSKIGYKNNKYFRLVGLENESNLFTDKVEENTKLTLKTKKIDNPYSYSYKGLTYNFNYDNLMGAFGFKKSDFMNHVISDMSNKSYFMHSEKLPKNSTQNKIDVTDSNNKSRRLPAGSVWSCLNWRVPSVLAQEINVLNDNQLEFGCVKTNDGNKKIVACEEFSVYCNQRTKKQENKPEDIPEN